MFSPLSDILPLLVGGMNPLFKLTRYCLFCTSPTMEVSFHVKGGAMDALIVEFS